jgi:hypothetical protein
MHPDPEASTQVLSREQDAALRRSVARQGYGPAIAKLDLGNAGSGFLAGNTEIPKERTRSKAVRDSGEPVQ